MDGFLSSLLMNQPQDAQQNPGNFLNFMRMFQGGQNQMHPGAPNPGAMPSAMPDPNTQLQNLPGLRQQMLQQQFNPQAMAMNMNTPTNSLNPAPMPDQMPQAPSFPSRFNQGMSQNPAMFSPSAMMQRPAMMSPMGGMGGPNGQPMAMSKMPVNMPALSPRRRIPLGQGMI